MESLFAGGSCSRPMMNEKKTSVQGEVEKALQTVLRSPARIPVKGCGRTDVGVSAYEFFCHFDLSEGIPDLEKFRHAVSSVLPTGISVLSLFEVSEDFHATDNVLEKFYEYRILVRKAKPAIGEGKYWWIHGEGSNFDVEKLTQATRCFLGEHDFKAFAAANQQAATTLRKINSIEVLCSPFCEPYLKDCLDSGIQIRLRFKARGFLKQMVRNMVGALVEVAQGKREAAEITRLLSSAADRKDAGYCAPTEGLFLVGVDYGRRF